MLKLAIILAAATVCYGRTPATFHLYTHWNQNNPQTMACSGASWEAGGAPRFNATHNTIVLVHGHGGDLKARSNTLIRTRILSNFRYHYNVIVVDWEEEAGNSYSFASARVPLVAGDLADCLTWLQGQNVVNTNNLHLVGFDLGAHVVGIAARRVRTTLGSVGRITGLDPSGRGWGTNSDRLRRTDAWYVEVIHTDGTGLLANGIGTAIGRINFYVNGGSNQPGCVTHSCSHERAFELFAASIFGGNLEGYPCTSITQMNLNLCNNGDPLLLGDLHLFKVGYSDVYRVYTTGSYPFYP